MNWLSLIVYNLLSLIVIPILALVRRVAKKEVGRLFPRLRVSHNTLWFHAASVGEVNAVKPLINHCISNMPGAAVTVTTMTTTGKSTASFIHGITQATLFPYDFLPSLIVRMHVLRPKALIIAETEMWPNLLLVAGWFRVPVVVVNGRLTMKSVKPYRRLISFWKPLWENVRVVCAQSEADAARYLELGFGNVVDAGNLKFAIDLPDYDADALREEWGFSKRDMILAFGSSRPGEEKMIADAYRVLRKDYPVLKLVIAPRHLDRMREVIEAFNGLDTARLSENRSADILVIDSMGVLNKAYAICDLALVGGSFFDFGGHNPLEPAYYSKPILMGPYHNSCKDTVRILEENGAIRIVSEKQLTETLGQMLSSASLRDKMGENARETLEKNRHSLEKNFDIVQEVMKS